MASVGDFFSDEDSSDSEIISGESTTSDDEESSTIATVTTVPITKRQCTINVKDLKWSQTDTPSTRVNYSGPNTVAERLQADVSSTSKPIDFYNLYMKEDIFERIAKETNKYAAQAGSLLTFSATNKNEIKIFWGLTLLMGFVKKPSVAQYWSTNELISTPLFGKVMSRNRYQELMRYLHFADNTDNSNSDDKLKKLRPYYDAVVTSFSQALLPGEHISIDESLIRFFGRLSFKTYMGKKSAKYGMKAYKACGVEGYTYKFELHIKSKSNDENEVYTGVNRIVMSLLRDYLDRGRKIWMDNFYNSPELFSILESYQTYAAGTVRLNRKGIPPSMKEKKKRKRGELKTRS